MEFSFTGLLKDEPDIIDRKISVVDVRFQIICLILIVLIIIYNIHAIIK